MATQTRQATGLGADEGWGDEPTAGPVNEKIDEGVDSHDSDSTYGYCNAPSGNATFTFSVFTVPAGSTINYVRVRYAVKLIGGTGYCFGRLTVSGSQYNSSTFSWMTTDYSIDSEDFATNPATTNAWTVSEVNGSALTEFGLRMVCDTATQARCSAVEVLVDYTPSVSDLSAFVSEQQRSTTF